MVVSHQKSVYVLEIVRKQHNNTVSRVVLYHSSIATCVVHSSYEISHTAFKVTSEKKQQNMTELLFTFYYHFYDYYFEET